MYGRSIEMKMEDTKNAQKTCFYHNTLEIVDVRTYLYRNKGIIFQYYIIQFYESISI